MGVTSTGFGFSSGAARVAAVPEGPEGIVEKKPATCIARRTITAQPTRSTPKIANVRFRSVPGSSA